MQLIGPQHKVKEFVSFVKYTEKKYYEQKEVETQMPYPVVIVSRGRAEIGNLNYEAKHVFGKRKSCTGKITRS